LKAAGRALRSVLFLAVYGLYLVFFFGLVQRLVIWPLTLLFPKKHNRIVSAWFRLLADSTLGLARIIGDVHIEVAGRVPTGSAVVVANHQSLLDIPLVYSTVGPPYPLIPTRALYAWGIPGVSLLLRLARHPLIGQKRESRRQDVVAIANAADAVAGGESSILIFPEGHRTRDGEIGPFMKAGLKAILLRARSPVYVLIIDGLWRSRTTADSLFNFAGMRGSLDVLGPLELRERMCAALDRRRGRPPQGRTVAAT
jgi:1-acyl-sn-glycerol-3-phosphate acyltransferase